VEFGYVSGSIKQVLNERHAAHSHTGPPSLTVPPQPVAILLTPALVKQLEATGTNLTLGLGGGLQAGGEK